MAYSGRPLQGLSRIGATKAHWHTSFRTRFFPINHPLRCAPLHSIFFSRKWGASWPPHFVEKVGFLNKQYVGQDAPFKASPLVYECRCGHIKFTKC